MEPPIEEKPEEKQEPTVPAPSPVPPDATRLKAEPVDNAPTHTVEQPIQPPAEIVQTPVALAIAPQRSLALVSLALLFIASAGLTAAYLANTSERPQAQTAAAAVPIPPFPDVRVGAKAAIVTDLATGRVLYAKNAGAQLPLASLAKVALVVAVADVLSLDSIITIPRDSVPTQSAGRLREGNQWRVRDLINYTLIASSNDGADILAAAADPAIRAKYSNAPDEDPTLWRMNELARSLGLANTYFLNVDGLDISATQSGGYGSARDVAALLAYAASTTPALFEGTTQGGMLLLPVEGKATEAYNTNKALGAISGLIMGKTGFTDLAGGNLGIVFDAGLMHPVVAVVLGSTEDGRFEDMKRLVEATEGYLARIRQ